MTYVFSYTSSNAQEHLTLWYNKESSNPFCSSKEIIDYLVLIYKNLYKVQNAQLDYKSLVMKTTKTFVDFYICFLHLVEQAKIPKEDLQLDLFNKLTIDL